MVLDDELWAGILIFGIILCWMGIRNYQLSKRTRLRSISDIYLYITDTVNHPVILMILYCFATILFLFFIMISDDLALIFHIFQQLILIVWYTGYMVSAVFALDPFSRHIRPDKLQKITKVLLVLIFGVSLLLIVNFFIATKHGSTIAAALLILIGLLIGGMAFIFGRILAVMLLQSRRSKRILLQGEKSSNSIYRFFRERYIGGHIILDDIAPFGINGCRNGIMLQNIIVERLLLFCVFGVIISCVKATWEYEYDLCEQSSEKCDKHARSGLSLWLPDTLFIAFWYFSLYDIFGMNVLYDDNDNQVVSSRATSRAATISNNNSTIVVESSNYLDEPLDPDDVLSRPYSIAPLKRQKSTQGIFKESFSVKEGDTFSFSGVSSPRPTLQLTDNPLARSSQRRSTPRRSNPLLRALGISPLMSKDIAINSNMLLQNCKIVRELTISCTEMILVDRFLYFPVPALFTGRATFIVLYMRKDIAGNSGKNMMNGNSSGNYKSSQQSHNEDDIWMEFGRSDCCTDVSSPNFSVTFIIPETLQSKSASDLSVVSTEWKIEIYNVKSWRRVHDSFNVSDAQLSDHILIGEYLFGNKDFNSDDAVVSRHSYLQSDNESSDREYDDMITTSKLERPIQLINLLSPNYIRLGGSITIKSTLMHTFSYVIANVMDVMNKEEETENEITDIDNIVTKSSLETDGEHSESIVKVNSKLDLSSRAMIKGFSLVRDLANDGNTLNALHAFQGNSDRIEVYEEMLESPFTFDVPSAYLKLLFEERNKELNVLRNRFTAEVNHSTLQDSNGEDLSWTFDLIEAIKMQIDEIHQRIIEFDLKTRSFKSSGSKSDRSVQFAPINLHLQIFTVNSNSDVSKDFVNHSNIYDFVTVGAFAAHCHRFKGGGMWHIMNKLEKVLKIMTNDQLPPHQGQFMLPDEVWNCNTLDVLPLDRKLFELAFVGRERLDACLPQCLSAIATGFISRIQLMTVESLELSCSIGMLFQFESLLSTQGSEIGMLSDMYVTVKVVERVHISVRELVSGEPSVKIYWKDIFGDNTQFLILDLGLPSAFFNKLPKIIRGGKSIPVIPVMFTVGINELQSYAETMQGRRAYILQDIINTENLNRVETYCSLLLKVATGAFDDNIADTLRSENETEEVSPSPIQRSTIDSLESDDTLASEIDISVTRRNAIRKTVSGQMLLAGGSSGRNRLNSIVMMNRNSLSVSGNSANSSELASAALDALSVDIEDDYFSSTANNETKHPFSKAPILKQTSIKKLWQDIEEEDSDHNSDIEDSAFRMSIQRAHSTLPQKSVFSAKSNDTTNDDDDDFDEENYDNAMAIAKAIDLKNEESNRTHTRKLSMSIRTKLNSIAGFVRNKKRDNKEPQNDSTINNPEEASHRPTLSGIYGGDDIEQCRRTESRKDSTIKISKSFSKSSDHLEKEGKEEEEVDIDILDDIIDPDMLAQNSFHDDRIYKSFSDIVLPSEERKREQVQLLQAKLTTIAGELRNYVCQSVGAGGKPWQILVTAAKLTRALEGVRCTSCKSAKDRTGMSVTLEEMQIVKDKFYLSDDESRHLLDMLRIHGVRIENAKKNVGKARFAFNTFQRRFLPEEYSPPLATTGSVQS